MKFLYFSVPWKALENFWSISQENIIFGLPNSYKKLKYNFDMIVSKNVHILLNHHHFYDVTCN